MITKETLDDAKMWNGKEFNISISLSKCERKKT